MMWSSAAVSDVATFIRQSATSRRTSPGVSWSTVSRGSEKPAAGRIARRAQGTSGSNCVASPRRAWRPSARSSGWSGLGPAFGREQHGRSTTCSWSSRRTSGRSGSSACCRSTSTSGIGQRASARCPCCRGQGHITFTGVSLPDPIAPFPIDNHQHRDGSSGCIFLYTLLQCMDNVTCQSKLAGQLMTARIAGAVADAKAVYVAPILQVCTAARASMACNSWVQFCVALVLVGSTGDKVAFFVRHTPSTCSRLFFTASTVNPEALCTTPWASATPGTRGWSRWSATRLRAREGVQQRPLRCGSHCRLRLGRRLRLADSGEHFFFTTGLHLVSMRITPSSLLGQMGGSGFLNVSKTSR